MLEWTGELCGFSRFTPGPPRALPQQGNSWQQAAGSTPLGDGRQRPRPEKANADSRPATGRDFRQREPTAIQPKYQLAAGSGQLAELRFECRSSQTQ